MSDFTKRCEQYLCPPGNGVFTVNTAKERKDGLHQKIYNCTGHQVDQKWKDSLENLETHKGSVLLGVCSDTGGGILRGANWGPLFLRNEIYKESPRVLDIGDIRVIPHLLMDKYLNNETISKCHKALYGDLADSLPVSPLSITYDFVENFYKIYKDKGLLSLGGDHSVSFPLTQPFLRQKAKDGKKIAIIHFDAHTDLLQQRLGIDICFGSWAYHILKDLSDPSLLYQIGIRSSGKDKDYWQKLYGVQQFWAHEVRTLGAEEIAKNIILDLKSKKVDELYISFDIDAIDAKYASSTGTPEPDGLDPHEAISIIKHISNEFAVVAADLVEVAPFLQTQMSSTSNEPDSTLLVSNQIIQLFIEKMNEFY